MLGAPVEAAGGSGLEGNLNPKPLNPKPLTVNFKPKALKAFTSHSDLNRCLLVLASSVIVGMTWLGIHPELTFPTLQFIGS